LNKLVTTNFATKSLVTMLVVIVVLGCVVVLSVPRAYGQECVSLIKGPVVFDVDLCRDVFLNQDVKIPQERASSITGLGRDGQRELFTTYQGQILQGQVIASQAVRSGFSPESGVLKGQRIKLFVPQGQLQCSEANLARFYGVIDEACCNGRIESPCMLPTAYVFRDFRKIGRAGGGDGDQQRREAINDPSYREAITHFRERRFRQAARSFEQARQKGRLDLRGHYLLGEAYQRLDMHERAISPLREIYDRSLRGDTWANDESVVRRAIFLLARCYARTGDAGQASLVLSGYLTEPRKYRRELEMSLEVSEFGFIHTSREFQEYEKKAREALGRR